MKGLKELLEQEKIKIEQNTHGVLKYGRVNFADEDDEITSIEDYELYATEEDYSASYTDYTVVKGGVVLMECVSASTVDDFLRHLVNKHPEAFVSSELSPNQIKKIKQIIKRFREKNLMPWYIEHIIGYEYGDLVIGGYINEKEFELLTKCEKLHDIVKDEYIGFMDVNIYIPEEVYDAYREARKDYRAAEICMYALDGVLDGWYDHVIFNWMKKFTNPKEAAYLLYMQSI